MKSWLPDWIFEVNEGFLGSMNNKMEMISVIIVNYNGKKWMPRCLDSLKSQTLRNFEVIIVDNASTDGSVDFILEEYGDFVRIINSCENLGFAGGNNLGIQQSLGKYVLLLNNDTWIEEEFLENLLTFFRGNDYDVIAPYVRGYTDGSIFEPYHWKVDPFGHPVKISGVGDGFYLSGASIFFEKKLYLDTHGLDEDFFMYVEEVDWFWRLQLLKKSFCYVPDVFLHHYVAGSTGSGLKISSFRWRNENTLQMLLKNYRWRNLIWVLPIYLAQNILEMLAFLLLGKFSIARTYVEGWVFNIRNLRKILVKRSVIQRERLVGDFEIMKIMYPGLGKLRHMFQFIRHKVST